MNSKSLFSALLLGLLVFSACQSVTDQAAAQPSSSSAVSSGPDGYLIFRRYCTACHGADGKLGLNGAKDLTASKLSLEERITIVTNGKNIMTPFGEILSPEEIKAVAQYTFTLK